MTSPRSYKLYPWAYCPGCKRVRRCKTYEGVYWIHNRPDRTLCGFSGQMPWPAHTIVSRFITPNWWQRVERNAARERETL